MKTKTKLFCSLCCIFAVCMLALVLVWALPVQKARAEGGEKTAEFDPNVSAEHLSITYGANVEVKLYFTHLVADGIEYTNFFQPISWHSSTGKKSAEWLEKVQADGSYDSAMDEILFDGKPVRYHLENTTMAGGINPVDASFVNTLVNFMISASYYDTQTAHTITFTKDYVFPTGYSFANDTTIYLPAGGTKASVMTSGEEATLSGISAVTEAEGNYTFNASFSNAVSFIELDVTETLAAAVSFGDQTVAQLNAAAPGSVKITANGTQLSFTVAKAVLDGNPKITFAADTAFPSGNTLPESVSKIYSFAVGSWVEQVYDEVEPLAPVEFNTGVASHLTIKNNGANVEIRLEFTHPVVGEANPSNYNNFLQPMSWQTGAAAKPSEWVDRVLTDGTYNSAQDNIFFDDKSVRECLPGDPGAINPVDANLLGNTVLFMINTAYYGQGAHALVLKEGLILPSGYYVAEDIVILLTAGSDLVLNQESHVSLAETGTDIAFTNATSLTENGEFYTFQIFFDNVLAMGTEVLDDADILSKIRFAGKTAEELGADVELTASYATLNVKIKKSVLDSDKRLSFAAGIEFPSGNTLASETNRTYIADRGIWFAAVEDIQISGLEDGKMQMSYGATLNVVATALPADAAVKKLSYSSSDETVVEILPNGQMTAVGEGKATITVASVGNPEVTKTFEVIVTKVSLEAIVLGQTSSTRRIGVSFDIVVNYQPSDVSVKGVTFRSSDTNVATVDANGKVVTVGPGTCEITVTYTDDPTKTAVYTLTVVKSVASLEITEPAKTEYVYGDSFDASGLKVTAVYDDGSKQELSSSDYTVTGFSASTLGEQIITVSYEGVTAEFIVEVKPASESGNEPEATGCGGMATASAAAAAAAVLALGAAFIIKKGRR